MSLATVKIMVIFLLKGFVDQKTSLKTKKIIGKKQQFKR
jgi:hypothetical protein